MKARKARKVKKASSRSPGHNYEGWTFQITTRAGTHFSIPLTMKQYQKLNDMVITTIVDGIGQCFADSDFGGKAPLVLLVGSKHPRVPLLLSRVISKIDRTCRARSSVKSKTFRLVNTRRDCLARGAAIYAHLQLFQQQTTASTTVHGHRGDSPHYNNPHSYI